MSSAAKEKMKKALIRLLAKKPFLEITVTDLVNEADVARASFYRMYSSLDGVVDDVLKDIEVGAVSSLVPVLIDGDETKVKCVIAEVLTRIKDRTIPYLGLLPENSQMIANKFAHRSIFSKEVTFNNVTDKYINMINLAIVLSVARTWSYYGFKETASELADFLYDYIYEGKYRKSF